MDKTTWISQVPLVQKNQFVPALVQQLYEEENITPNELMVLEFMARVDEGRKSTHVFSFQGIKRLTKLHQAKLGKAMNRLIEKKYIRKIKEGYVLTPLGKRAIHRIFLPQPQTTQNAYDTITFKQVGFLRNYTLTKDDIHYLRENLSGKWFGSLKYLACNLDHDNLEIEWANFDNPYGFIAAKAWITPPNQIVIESAGEDSEITIIALEQLREKLDNLLVKTIGQAPDYSSISQEEHELGYYSSS